ncbi:MAG: aspartate--tRNA ligase [Nanobdellota archaeon]
MRTHTCGELRKDDKGKEVTISGWVNKVREHGNLSFVDIRDRYGITQVTADKIDVTRESVVKVTGQVVEKPEPNKELATGDIEIKATDIKVLSKAKPLPLDLNNTETTEETRLKYRYLDLRSRKMQDNLKLRHKTTMSVRNYLDKLDFLELETPVLGKSTPEGARDYLVPSRVNRGKFFALPQSPQVYKQLFQVAGLDRYFQIVKCFRDEDLRADRQPEFTQIDMEMSFVDEGDVFSVVEGMVKHIWKDVLGKDLNTPFRRITYDEAMLRYGSDKPDLRFGLEIQDLTEWAKGTDFKVFNQAPCVRAIKVNSDFSRKNIDKLTDVVKVYGAKGLAWFKKENGELSGGISKFIKEEPFEMEDGDHVFFVADKENVVAESLGALRLELGKRLDLVRDEWNFCWVTDFPMLEWSEEDGKYEAMHHPFTSPRLKDREYLKEAPEKAKARAYDLTLNGVELGGGSIRIHDRELQQEVFDALGISKEDQEKKFGFMLGAFDYGAPPHGGIAFGFDRMVMLLTGMDNIREVIAFPKNKEAQDLMLDAPSDVSKEQLDELGIKSENN